MKKWITQWFALGGDAATDLADRATPGLSMREVLGLIEADLMAGVQRERLRFALVMLFEGHAAARAKIAGLRRRCIKEHTSCSR